MTAATTSRLGDLRRFYDLLQHLDQRIGGTRMLADCSGRMNWPQRGVYFFFESGEMRSDSGTGPRVVRVGTHALTGTSRTTLWNRLSQHRGSSRSGGGNHRGSIFRLLVGSAMARLDAAHLIESWGKGGSADAEIRRGEFEHERRVSVHIRAMPFLWLPIDDEPGRESLRLYVERNSIALLSNFERPVLDPPSAGWLGHTSDRERVRKSGLWNQNHVEESYDPAFLGALEELIECERMKP